MAPHGCKNCLSNTAGTMADCKNECDGNTIVNGVDTNGTTDEETRKFLYI